MGIKRLIEYKWHAGKGTTDRNRGTSWTWQGVGEKSIKAQHTYGNSIITHCFLG